MLPTSPQNVSCRTHSTLYVREGPASIAIISQGTFDDLSEDEKTRALLQFLQYHQQLEGKSENGGQFKDLVDGGAVDVYQANNVEETMDEKAVEESLKVWYGLTNGGPGNTSYSFILSAVVSAAMAMLMTAP